ncbi:hypothetical protein [Pseudomonas avellanae]|uniref:hypothetical protein n=1 Tax=Pseudomonas avellanae TaxID=46257 RepID=UPI000463F8EE|nr:hypothetical protein [Pseudomonas avellanae]
MAAPFVGLYDDIGTSVDRIKTFRLTMKKSMRVFLDRCGLKTEKPGLTQRDDRNQAGEASIYRQRIRPA